MMTQARRPLPSPSQALRKLAEEIVVLLGCGSPTDVEGLFNNALPELSGLLGELAVAREALRSFVAYEQWWYEDADNVFRCDFCAWGESEEPEAIEHHDSCPRKKAQAALSSDAGRLAGELIRAVARERFLYARPLSSHSDLGRIAEEHEASADVSAKLDALLSAFPAIRAEVEYD